MSSRTTDPTTDVYVTLEFTPNPNTLKYAVSKQLLGSGAVNFLNAQEALTKSPLATKLFTIPGIVAIMIGKTFVTITKSDDGDWDLVHQKASQLIEQHLSAGEAILTEEASQRGHQGGNSEIENRIRDILDQEIRPAVAMDGGDITFEKYENGTVYLYLQGSCSGCPSSTATLKVGIETRLKDAIPEIQEVVAV